MSRPRRLPAVVAVCVATAAVVHGVTDNETVANVCYLGALVGASIGAWVGYLLAPRGRRLVSWLIAVGLALTALGDVLWTGLDLAGAGTDVSIADAPWFTSYLFLCAAMWAVLGRSAGSGTRVAVDLGIDAVTIAFVCVLVLWTVSIGAIVADHSVTAFVRAVWAGYPIADAVLLGLVVRVLLSRAARASLPWSFAVGVCLWLAADITYMQLPDTGTPGALMDAAWMIGPVLMATAAWRTGAASVETSPSEPRGGWAGALVIAVGPLLVPPALEIFGDVRGEPGRPMRLLVGTVVLGALACLRTARLLRSEERALHDLAVTRDLALSASQAKSLFLTNMSHEIRTPLTTVLAAAELLENTELDECQHGLLAKMNRSGQMLQALVEGLLDFSRIESGQLKLDVAPFDLPTMIADATDAYRPRATRANLRFETSLDPRLPRTLLGDRDRLFQVLTNLLDNAIKFTERGSVTLTVQPAARHSQAGADGLEMIVADTGIGIAEEDHQKVFESFHQVDGSITRARGGNGLGLAICRELVELMGGTISVLSQLGQGSQFVVHVPFAPARVTQTSPVLRAV